jgi:uncharacterized protein
MLKPSRSTEEEYFFNLNKVLVDEQRKKLDAERGQVAKNESQGPHWMKCPKCGGQLEEIDKFSIKIDKCTSCAGLFFDAGELELLLESQKPEGFFKSFKKALL